MKSISFIPMISQKLASEFCSKRILDNPRMSEIDDILIAIARNYGTMLDDEVLIYPYYQSKLEERAYHLLNTSNIVQAVDGNVKVTMPESRIFGSDYSKTETIEYTINQAGDLERTHSITERNGETIDKQNISVSKINEDGIEIERRTDIREGEKARTLVYERVEGSPNIVRRTEDGKTEEYFYDMTNSKRFETLIALKETKIQKQEIKPISSEQQKTIIENNRYSDYIEGIKRLIERQKAVSVDEGTGR